MRSWCHGRAIAKRIGDGHILAIDRSAKAIKQARAASQEELASGRMSIRQVAIEEFELEPGERPFDIAFAVRVGALDGRHRHLEQRAHRQIAKALAPNGQFFVDAGNPLRRIDLARELLRLLPVAPSNERLHLTAPLRGAAGEPHGVGRTKGRVHEGSFLCARCTYE